ncbi:MAG: carcinine hydrolase/isopenicillin-N N-acyltransferase family protein [Acidobacteriota bacterium]
MSFNRDPGRVWASSLISLFIIAGLARAQQEIVEVRFQQPPRSMSDEARTQQSIVKVQGTGGMCQDGLYLITHFGDREELFRKENQKALDTPMIQQTWRFCSVFSAGTEHCPIIGRNWDNQNVGSIIVSFYQPPNGYSSISFTRAIDIGFPLNVDLEQVKGSEMGNRLLLAPFYAMDGINEHGLTVAVAGVRPTTHAPRANKQLVFTTFLIRMILDRTRSVEEAVAFINDFIPFDLDRNSFNAHFLVADASGRSVILEHEQDQWRIVRPQRSWQVLTTKPVFGVPDASLREQCWRFRTISEALDKTRGNADRSAGMKLLQEVAQKGTTWSVVYAPKTLDLHFSVYQKWDVLYHLEGLWPRQGDSTGPASDSTQRGGASER